MISSKSSSEMNKVNTFSALTAPRPFIFLSNLSIADEVVLVTNLGKTSLAKGTAKFNSVFLPKCSIILLRNQSDSIILEKSFLMLVFLNCYYK